MNVLLDACALIALANHSLPRRAATALRSAPEALVCVVSPWEIALKATAGRLQLGEPVATWYPALATRYTLITHPLDLATVFAASALPPLHRDPFDRVLVALAQARALTLLTSDRIISTYPGVQTLW